MSIIILPRHGLAVFHTQRFKGHLLRGVSQSTSQTFLMIAFSLMPLASAVAINFSAPIFATLASMIFLRETVGVARWSAILVGFFGVLIVTSPGTDTFTIGALFALANAVHVRHRDRRRARPDRDRVDRDADHVSDADHVGGVLADAAVRLRRCRPGPTPAGSCSTASATGSRNIGGRARIHLAPTSVVSPFQYFSLIWAMMLGFAIWGDVPTVSLLIGGAIVAGSGLFLLWRESRKAAASAADVGCLFQLVDRAQRAAAATGCR